MTPQQFIDKYFGSNIRYSDSLKSKAEQDLSEMIRELYPLLEAVKWVLRDASYKAPESINYDIASRWIEHLRKAYEGVHP